MSKDWTSGKYVDWVGYAEAKKTDGTVYQTAIRHGGTKRLFLSEGGVLTNLDRTTSMFRRVEPSPEPAERFIPGSQVTEPGCYKVRRDGGDVEECIVGGVWGRTVYSTVGGDTALRCDQPNLEFCRMSSGVDRDGERWRAMFGKGGSNGVSRAPTGEFYLNGELFENLDELDAYLFEPPKKTVNVKVGCEGWDPALSPGESASEQVGGVRVTVERGM